MQVLRSGNWRTLQPVTSVAESEVYGFDVIGKDASLAAHSSTVATVRVTYRKDTPTGKATVQPCVFVNEGSIPFRGTTSCGPDAPLTVLTAGSTGSTGGTPTPAPTTSTEAPPATSGTSGASSQLARTGSSGTSTIAAAAGAFLLAGAGALGVMALRRRTRA